MLLFNLECYVDTEWIWTSKRYTFPPSGNSQVTVIFTATHDIRIQIFIQTCYFKQILSAEENLQLADFLPALSEIQRFGSV